VEDELRKIVVAASLLGLALGAGCSRSSEKTEKKLESTTAPVGLKPDTENGATVTGKIAFTGKKPVLREIDMSANAACQKIHPKPVPSEEVVVGSDGALANVFVWVKEGVPEGKWAAPSTPVVVDQKGCIYTPHVSGAVTGQPIEFRNSDETNHNIHPLPRQNQEWNESQPPKGDPKVKTFDKEEVMVPVKCNVHPWMRAYVGAVRHPFFAVSGEDGTFKIAGLPPGNYKVEAWHERFGRQEIPLTVAAKETKSADFTFTAKN